MHIYMNTNLDYSQPTMKMAKPKLHFSLQICRPKNPCSMIKSPLSRAPPHMLSPLNSKTFDISFPGTPIPPPSTPSSRVAPVADCGSPSSFNAPASHPGAAAPPSNKKKHKNAKHKACNESDDGFLSPPRSSRRLRRYGSKEESSERRKAMVGPCMAEQERSFVVVKKSVDPYEDFKRSMREMIVAKHIVEPKELEQLLMSFLSLNSRLHHKVIIEAFTQILKEVFCG